MLTDAGRLAMLVCMVVASTDKEGDGSFDADPEYLRRVAYLDSQPDLTPLVASGFLVPASTCKQSQAKDIPSVSVSVSEEGGMGETKVDDIFQDLPNIFSTPQFRLAWVRWEKYYREVHHRTFQPSQRGPAWSAMAEKFPNDAKGAITAINTAIAAGWKTIHRSDGKQSPPRPDTIYLTADEIEAETMRRQREHDERRKNTAPRPGTRENAGQPGHAIA